MIELNDLIMVVLLLLVGEKINHMTRQTRFIIRFAYVSFIIILFYRFISTNKVDIEDSLLYGVIMLILYYDRRKIWKRPDEPNLT